MKDKIEIIEYKKVDADFNEIIRLHQLIFEESDFENKLIYFDSNFSIFFKDVISDHIQNRLTILKVNDSLAGFIHFKIMDDILFLNNICLDTRFRGYGLGNRFLKESIDFCKDLDIAHFMLDVFSDNKKALQWYEKLGLKIISETKWIQLVSPIVNRNDTLLSYYKNDDKGFKSIYVNQIKIATVINNKNLIINNPDYVNCINLEEFENSITTHNIDGFLTTELDRSYRMKGLLKNVIKNLTHE